MQPTRIHLALFLSGFAGLMHEIVWARLLVNLIGNTAHAQAAVLTVFMGGLALGAVLFGRRSDRRPPLRIYVALEVLIGIYCLGLPLLVGAAGAGYEGLAPLVFESAGLKLALRFALALSIVLVPALLMGGTLPVLARYLIEEVGQTRRRVAGLYALNNLGAVLGAGAAGFWTLPALGVFPSLALASAMNLAAAALVFGPALRERQSGGAVAPAAVPEPTPPPAYGAIQFRVTLLALALSGFAAMGYEVVFSRIIALSFGSSAHSFTVMLMAFITGIGVGSALLTFVRVKRPLWLFGASQLAVVVALIAVMPLVSRWPYLIGLLRIDLHGAAMGYELHQAGKAGLILIVLLIPTACIGFGFPLVSQIQARSLDRIGGAVGSTYAWNTVGNVLGVVVTSLLLIRLIGIRGSLELLLALNLVAGLLVLAVTTEAPAARRLAAVGGCTAVVLLYALFGTGWPRTINYATDHLRMRTGPEPWESATARASHPSASFAAWKKEHVKIPEEWDQFFFEEEADTTVIAARRDRDALLFVNSKGDASTLPQDMVTQVLLGQLPLFAVPEAREVLVIGYGSGVTCGSALQHPIEHLDLVEISRGVLGADEVFAPYNHHALSDPKLTTWIDDGRSFLRTAPGKYDVIISEPSNPWIAGIGNLFTVEFFEDGRERLNPGGVMVIWFHQYEQSNESVELVLRTVSSVFPHVNLFLSFYEDSIALASMEPIEFDPARMEERFDQPAVRRDLARIGIFDLCSLLSHHGVSSTRFPELAPLEGPLNRDLHQRYEYMANHSLFEGGDSKVIFEAQGFEQIEAGRTDCLLDRYLEWRRERGQPISRSELERARARLARTLWPDHRIVRLVDRRIEKARGAPPPGAPPSRGGSPPIAEMDFDEAYNHALERIWAEAAPAAVPYLRRAVALDPDHPLAAANLAQSLLGMGQVQGALDAVEASLGRRPSDVRVLLLAAQVHDAAGDHGRAAERCRAILAIEENLDALTLLGDLEAKQQRYDRAVPFYERVLTIDPTHWQAAAPLIQILAMNPQTADQARQLLQESLQHNPDQPLLQQLRQLFQ